MTPLSQKQRLSILQVTNSWWHPPHQIESGVARQRPRPFLQRFVAAIKNEPGLWMHGPRGTGKTMLLHHGVQALLDQGLPPGNICYVPADHPAVSSCKPGDVMAYWLESHGQLQSREVPRFLFVDEPVTHIQEWQELVCNPNDGIVVVIATSVVPVPVKGKKAEPQVARFFLPPITFPEFTAMMRQDPVGPNHENGEIVVTNELIQRLDQYFSHYLMFGGFTGGAASPFVSKAGRQILPTGQFRELMGVGSDSEIRELMLVLAYLNGQRISPENLSKAADLSKNTLRKYMGVLEDAHLVRVLHRISKWGSRLKRARDYRPFLGHPSLRRLLLGVDFSNEAEIENLGRAALLIQLPPSPGLVEHPWEENGLGLVHLNNDRRVAWAMEINYRDDNFQHDAHIEFCRIHHLKGTMLTTRTRFERLEHNGVALHYIPLALQTYVLGYRLTHKRNLKLVPGN